ncbi:hypothetical protein CBS63078_3510 [Aspergillus niger]|nr:hypothetical protein CBS63078_3510 [Aspergillus niger]KAI3032778.1 hypothetical protein CBS147347_1247 [Aspergillus niger]KAI3083941.1 hypothetical protein CBS147353_2085 [Aspergillus niger]
MAVTDLHSQQPEKPQDPYTKALTLNHLWAQKTTLQNPSLFPTLARAQHPQILWIGCSDSRCPETTLLDLKPGDVFVHRNIANVVNAADVNCAAVVEYAVLHLKVKHVVNKHKKTKEQARNNPNRPRCASLIPSNKLKFLLCGPIPLMLAWRTEAYTRCPQLRPTDQPTNQC